MAETILDRFWSKVDTTEDCWEWTATTTHGYGYFTIGRRAYRAHRFAYEITVGPIPDGLDLDHLCRNRTCVNPDHLEPVTHRENLMRGFGWSGRNARKTHCGKCGEEYDAWSKDRGRYCRPCRRKWWRERYGPAAVLADLDAEDA